MTLNTSGILAVFQAASRPSLLLPKIVVRDIRQLDLKKLKARGVTAVVLDKDNCLTKPRHDGVVEELQEAWPALVRAFGRRNILIVSNSAGTRDDAGLLQAESVSRHLGVPILLHAVKKPGCAKAVYDYFSSASDDIAGQKGKGKQREVHPRGPVVDVAPARVADIMEEHETSQNSVETKFSGRKRTTILLIGDRVMTDIVLANRINLLQSRTSFFSRIVSLFRSSSTSRQQQAISQEEQDQGGVEAIPVLTTTIWQMEGPGSRFMRALEGWTMRLAIRSYTRRRGSDPLLFWRDCVLQEAEPTEKAEMGMPVSEPTRIESSRSSQTKLQKGLGMLVSPSIRFYATLRGRIQKRLDAFLSEARQTQFGFRLPEGYGRVRSLRRILEGDQRQIMRKGL